MSGYTFIGSHKVINSYVSDGKAVRILYECPECSGSGVLFDVNDEPMAWCLCSVGEAVRQSANAGGARS